MRDAEPQFGLGRSILYSAIIVAFFLGVAELSVRGWAYYMRDDAERFDIQSQTFVLIPGEHRSGPVTASINQDGFAGAELKPDGPDLFRIAAVGDSCTYGDGNAVHTYPAIMQKILDERERPGRRYEVVNAGISGMNSELALRRLRTKVLSLEPDLVTIYIGWNDLMKFDPAAQTLSAGASPVARALDHLWLVKGLRKLIFFHLRPYLRPPATGPESRTGRFADFKPDIYEGNLREIIRTVRSIGSQPVLLTLPTVVRPEMTAADLRRAGVIFPYFSSAYGVGDLLDLIATYNATIHRVGLEMSVPVLDIARVFEQVEAPEEYLFDTMHATTKGKRLIAEKVIAGLDREQLLGAKVEDAPVSQTEAWAH